MSNENITPNDIENENSEQQQQQTEPATDQQQEPAAEQPAEEAQQPSELEQLQAKFDELNDKYLRLSAEYDNFRKRTLKEKMELTKNAGSDIIIGFLPVMDDFERALAHMNDQADVAALRQGVELIYKKFNEYLAKRGVTPIETAGVPFNTDEHEAVTKMPAPSPDMKGKVFDCIEKGYKMNDKVIRFSKVVVCE